MITASFRIGSNDTITVRLLQDGSGYDMSGVNRVTCAFQDVVTVDSDVEGEGLGQVFSWGTTAWASGTEYDESSIITNGGSIYKCSKAHTSSTSNEPGSGDDWTDYWETTSDSQGYITFIFGGLSTIPAGTYDCKITVYGPSLPSGGLDWTGLLFTAEGEVDISSTEWDRTVNQIVKMAYRKLGIPGRGGSLGSDRLADGIEVFNNWLHSVQNKHTFLKALRTRSFYTNDEVGEYFLDDHALDVREAVVINSSGGRTPLTKVSLSNYFNLSSHDTSGMPTRFALDKQYPALKMLLDPVPDSTSYQIEYIAEVDFGKVEDGDTFELKPNAFDMCVYSLAELLAPEQNVEDKLQVIAPKARELRADFFGAENETGDLRMRPYIRRNIYGYR